MWERQRRSFENVAEAYDRYRHSYPDDLFVELRRYADLAPKDDGILEIGCGTGRATVHLATWPNRVVAIEPARAMADAARKNLTDFGNVEVVTSTFEEAVLEPGSFGLVVVAQAFHWLDPQTRYERVTEALYAHGTIGLISNTQINTPPHRAFFERVQSVYEAHVPGMEHQGEFITEPGDDWLREIEGTELFDDVERLWFPWEWTLDTDHYLGLMSTHSNKAAMPADQRIALLNGIGELIDAEFGGHVTEQFVAELYLGRKRS